ncbi:MAG: DNA-3-methyladenine glycosylase [Ferrovibrio sp.]|uniref:DNA-3-methyladenine glycosylase family protein n=1 Tax=Ferrovibrio sp. TaxID=1917215 RepID=UPI00261929E4|nr:DNA-3-methyladenine glycosylase [Ferrovibrio sp.]MCW0232402.1 DNA-3-methyladenine glycosylase [Ferrovibrio sp.]
MANLLPVAKPDSRKRTKVALEQLCAHEPRFAEAFAAVGFIADRRRPADFANLCRIVIEQQISVAAAATIWGRLEAAVQGRANGVFSPERVLKLSEARLRACGLSGPKVRYVRNMAQAAKSGAIDFALLPQLEDHAAMAMLTEVKGIGRWTAEIFLMFALDREDIWPAHDVALQEAVKRLFGLKARPDVKKMDRMAENWRPHRGVAARLLWRYYAVTAKRLTTDHIDKAASAKKASA